MGRSQTEVTTTQRRKTAVAASMGSDGATKYPVLMARCKFLGIVRPDLQFAVEETSRSMALPACVDMERW